VFRGGRGGNLVFLARMMPMPPPMIGMPMPADDKLKQAQRAKAPGGKDDKVTTVFVGGLRKSTTEDKVIGHFSKFGQVDNVDIKRLPDGTSRGFAFVKFVDRESVDKVIEAKSSHMIDNKWVAVRPHGGSAFAAAQNAERSKQAEEIRKKEKHEDDLQQEDYEEKWSERYLQQAASMQKDEGDGTGEAKEGGGDSMMNPMMAMMGMMNPMMMGMMNPMMMRPPMMMGCGCPGMMGCGMPGAPGAPGMPGSTPAAGAGTSGEATSGAPAEESEASAAAVSAAAPAAGPPGGPACGGCPMAGMGCPMMGMPCMGGCPMMGMGAMPMGCMPGCMPGAMPCCAGTGAGTAGPAAPASGASAPETGPMKEGASSATERSAPY